MNPMSESSGEFRQQVRKIVREYLQPNITLHDAERLQRAFDNQEVSFVDWNDVATYYEKQEWDRDKLQEFVSVCKDLVESGRTSIAETYFNFTDPELSREDILVELDRYPYDEQEGGASQEGFIYEEQDNGVISGRYIEVDIRTDLSWSGDLIQLTSERSISFRIHPEDSLLIIEGSSVIDTQKAKSVFSRLISLPITTLSVEAANEDIEIVNSFFDELSESPGLEFIRIDKMSLNSPVDVNVAEIEISGRDILSSTEVSDRLDEGWQPKKVTGLIKYQNETFEITLGLTEVMSYAKVGEIYDYRTGKELMDTVREIFISYFGLSHPNT